MGALNVQTDDKGTKVYKQIKTATNGNNYPIYSTQVSSKDKAGNWKSAYVTLRFKNGVDVPNKSVIKIKQGFISFNPNVANGAKYPFVFVNDFEIIEEGEDSLSTAIDNLNDDFTSIPDGLDSMEFM